MSEQQYKVVLAFFGSVPVTPMTKSMEAYCEHYKDVVIWYSDHPESVKFGATMCLAVPVKEGSE